MDEMQMQSPWSDFYLVCTFETIYVFAGPCDPTFIEPEIIRTLFKLALGNTCTIPMSDGEMDSRIAVHSRLAAIRAAANSFERGEASMREMVK